MSKPNDQRPKTVVQATQDARVERIIAWLLRNRDEIDTMAKGKLEFNFAGVSLRPALTRYDDA